MALKKQFASAQAVPWVLCLQEPTWRRMLAFPCHATQTCAVQKCLPSFKVRKSNTLSENKGQRGCPALSLNRSGLQWMQEESQILHPCRRPREMGPKALRSITAEPLQLRNSLSGELRGPMDPGAQMLLHQPNPRPEKKQIPHGGFPGNPHPHPISCCARLEEHLEHQCHPENHSPTAFGLQCMKVRVLGCPAGGFISVLGFFGPPAVLGHTTPLMTCHCRVTTRALSVGALILTTP